MADLKPCPFCGGRADWWETESDTHRFQIVCVECCCGTDECVTEEVALKRWNARKPMEAVVAELEAKRKGYEEAGKVFNGTHGSGIRLSYALKQGAILEAMEIVRNGGKE